MPINWVDVADPHNPPAGAPKLEAANLNKLAVIADAATAGTPTGDALKAAYAPNEPRVVQFALQAGVDRTGAAACDSQLASILSSASRATPVTVTFGPGTYKFTQPWGVLDQGAVSFVGAPGGATTIDFTALAAGTTAVTVYTDAQRYVLRPFMRQLRVTGPATAATFLNIGGADASHWAPYLTFDGLDVLNFDKHITVANNAYLLHFRSCMFGASNTASVTIAGVTNSGENICFQQCAFYNNTSETIVCAQAGADLFFDSCSFDYNGRALNLSVGFVQLSACHIEGSDARVVGSEYLLVSSNVATNGSAPRLLIDGGQAYLRNFTARPQLVTISGDGNGSVQIRDTKIGSLNASNTSMALVADTASSPSTVVIDEVAPDSAMTVPATAQTATNGIVSRFNQFGAKHTLGGSSGNNRDLKFSTLSSGALMDRWIVRVDNTAETGGNAGSNFQFLCRTDAGASLYTVFNVARPSGVFTFGRGVAFAPPAQTLAAAGSVQFNAYNGTFQEVTLQANATSSSIINPNSGQLMTISWLQDATGGRSYVWPTNCKFAGASAPSDTTANRRTTVTFYYNGGFWWETARAVAVG